MENWDLTPLFKNEDELKSNLEKNIILSSEFKAVYENNLTNLSIDEFLNSIKKYEELMQNLANMQTYIYLVFAQDTKKSQFYAYYEQECNKIEENLLFFELEICDIDEKKIINFIENAKEYEYYLNNLINNKKHYLSKNEEKIMLHLSNTGANAFSRLFDENMSLMKIKFDGKKISEEEILSKLYNNDRNIRKKAAKKFSKALNKNSFLLTYIFNIVKTEHKTIAKLRNYKSVEQIRHTNNQISQKSVDSLIKTTEENFDLVSKFYKKKKKILGYDKLKDYDRYAPIGKEIKINFKQAKEIILQAFGNFCQEFKDIAIQAFNEGWIDVYPKDRKQSGAFSHSATSSAHPYILLNYTNQRRDLFTLAHELGHSIHQKLSYNVSYLNQNTALTTAETASVFAEMLVFDYMKEKLENEELLALYAAKIEDIFATLYRQINFTTFERRIYSFDKELSKEEIDIIWMEESKKMFQDSVILRKDYSSWWSYIPHFIHTPFYCYSYSYAQLLVLALYGLYKSNKCENFTEKYIKMLSLGGSMSPKNLVKIFDFDIEDENFWKIGIKEVKNLVNEFEQNNF